MKKDGAYVNNIFLNGKRVWVGAQNVIGKGGEADVYDIGHGQALKLFKPPAHPDFQMQPEAREAARQRLEEHQQKLRQFPSDLPQEVVVPLELATNDAKGQHIVGYSMPFLQGAEVLLRYSDRTFRESSGIGHNEVTQLFRNLWQIVEKVHGLGVVIGDFNDLNVLVDSNGDIALIDADSFQFGGFLCRTFTTRFLDPLHSAPDATQYVLNRPHSTSSDWYAFCVMLMQCLLYVDPYGGLYRPKDSSRRVAHHLRPLERITVFHPEVRYPKPALPYNVLPDDLLHFFQNVFEYDRRETFPRPLLESLHWSTCKNCGLEYARSRCPHCDPQAPAADAAVREKISIRGHVTATRICHTSGIVLLATSQGGRLRYLLHENGAFKRENGTTIAQGELTTRTVFRILHDSTLLGRDGQLISLRPEKAPERLSVDSYRSLPVFDTNGDRLFWLQAGQLWRKGQIGPEYIGDVLAGQTQFWTGPEFGFGFYRAGAFNIAFVFDTRKGGLNDSVPLPAMPGQLYDACCVFSAEQCWFLIALQENGQLIHRCFVIGADGRVVASAQSESGGGEWLGAPLHGKCATGNALLAPTDEGIVRVELIAQPSGDYTIAVTKTFPDTEPFVHAGTQLVASSEGLYAVGQQEIHLLRINTT